MIPAIGFGNVYDTEYDAVIDGIMNPKQETMQDNNEIDASVLHERKSESDLPIKWDVSDWFFDKPKAPVVGKPEVNPPVTDQQRLEGAFAGTRQMEQDAIGRMMDKRQRENTQAGLLHKIADQKGLGSEGPYPSVRRESEMTKEEVDSFFNDAVQIDLTMDKDKRNYGVDMSRYPDYEGMVDKHGSLVIRKKKPEQKPDLISELKGDTDFSASAKKYPDGKPMLEAGTGGGGYGGGGLKVEAPLPKQPIAYEILEKSTGKIIGRHNISKPERAVIVRRSVRTKIDKLDNEYGSYNYSMRPVYE